MAVRTFGGHTVSELKKLRQNPANGARFYLVLLESAPDFFNLAGEAKKLEAVIEKLVSILEKAAYEVSAQGGNDAAVALLRNALSNPALRKVTGA